MEIIEKVKEIYPIHGFNKTKKILKIGDKRLRRIIIEYRLEKNSKVKIDFFDKNFIYLLGLIWSDGYLSKKSYTIYIECIKEDMEKFKPILESISSWSFYERKREFKPMVNAYITDKKLYNILVENDYLYKSKFSPTKICSKIPDIMKKYFLLGIIDGDGCFYHNKKQYTRQFVITSRFEQDWSVFEKILDDINVKHSTIRRNNKKSAYSQLRVTNKRDLIKIGEYIYDEMIVLDRKYESWKLTIS